MSDPEIFKIKFLSRLPTWGLESLLSLCSFLLKEPGLSDRNEINEVILLKNRVHEVLTDRSAKR